MSTKLMQLQISYARLSTIRVSEGAGVYPSTSSHIFHWGRPWLEVDPEHTRYEETLFICGFVRQRFVSIIHLVQTGDGFNIWTVVFGWSGEHQINSN